MVIPKVIVLVASESLPPVDVVFTAVVILQIPILCCP